MNTIRITPQEAFNLRNKTTTDELNISHDIHELFMENASTGDDQWDMMRAMATGLYFRCPRRAGEAAQERRCG